MVYPVLQIARHRNDACAPATVRVVSPNHTLPSARPDGEVLIDRSRDGPPPTLSRSSHPNHAPGEVTMYRW